MQLLWVPLLLMAPISALTEQTKAELYANNGCNKTDYRTVSCVGGFNVSAFLRSQNLGYVRQLKLYDTSITSISKETGFDFTEKFGNDIEISGILVQNAPNLTYIDSHALSPLRGTLRQFKAIATGLPDYNNYQQGVQSNPFENFGDITVGITNTENSCPDPKVIFPCTCQRGEYDIEFDGLYGTSSGALGPLTNTTRLSCTNDTIDGAALRDVFKRIATSGAESRRFDIVDIAGENITYLPRAIFAGVGITKLRIQGAPNLWRIDRNAFETSAESIQFLQIDKANFTGTCDDTVSDLFESLSSLVNVRNLRLFGVGLPYIPNAAFRPKDGQKMHNLQHLAIAFDRSSQISGVQKVGSYAFAGAPNLRKIGLIKNFIQKFDPYSFAFNQTRKFPLKVEVGVNPFNDTIGLEPNAFSGSRGPLTVKFEVSSFDASDSANTPGFETFPENVFRPFLEEHSNNTFVVDHHNVEIWCDEKSKWMFDPNGVLTPRVERGIKIIRVEDNLVQMERPESFRCKPESSFRSLPNCLMFPAAELIHCGGDKFDVKQQFQKLAEAGLTNFSKLVFSPTAIEELPKGCFERFSFTEVNLIGARSLRAVHPEAFGSLTTKVIRQLSVRNTSLSEYPNLANYPKLWRAKLDDTRSVTLSKSTFNFTAVDPTSILKASSQNSHDTDQLNVFFDRATLENSTFSLLNNVSLTLNIGQRKDCSTIACLTACQPPDLKLNETVFRPFLESNRKNKIETTCHMKCNCANEWLYTDRKKFKGQFSGISGGDFACADPDGETIDFWGIKVPKTHNGTYFAKHCRRAFPAF